MRVLIVGARAYIRQGMAGSTHSQAREAYVQLQTNIVVGLRGSVCGNVHCQSGQAA